MKVWVLILATLLIIVPEALNAATLGLYFDMRMSGMSRDIDVDSFFDVYLYLCAADHYVNALEYQIVTPYDPDHELIELDRVTLADNAVLEMGDPLSGHSIAFWPPINGYYPGYAMISKMRFLSHAECPPLQPGPTPVIVDYPIVVGPHPDSGQLIGATWPEGEIFPIIGLRSTLCPRAIGTEKTSWGAIKSLF
jgi:hypothetical protein